MASGIGRRQFLSALGGMIVVSSLAAYAQQAGVRRIGILFGGFSDTDSELHARVDAFTLHEVLFLTTSNPYL